jgi:hypothetical protein
MPPGSHSRLLGHIDDMPGGQLPDPSQFMAETRVAPLHRLSREGVVVSGNEQPMPPLH